MRKRGDVAIRGSADRGGLKHLKRKRAEIRQSYEFLHDNYIANKLVVFISFAALAKATFHCFEKLIFLTY